MPVTLLFLLVSVLYASVGFGGGSSYIAVLALFGYPYQSIPILALICNIIVVLGGVVYFYKRGHFKWSLFWPFIVSSIPMSFLGGRMPIEKDTFLTLLGVCLFGVGARLIIFDRKPTTYEHSIKPKISASLVIGAALGLLSGLIGIGGGIFLAPILLTLKWGQPKQVAATAAFFIFVNSISGLLGQLIKTSHFVSVTTHWPLFLAVLVGGQVGSRMGSGHALSQRVVKDLTAVLVVFIGAKILFT